MFPSFSLIDWSFRRGSCLERVDHGLKPILTAVAVLVIGASGCRWDRGPERVVDLVDAFAGAGVSREIDEIDFGNPVSIPFLGSGWAIPKTQGDVRSRAWGVGEQSELMFFRLRPEDLILTFHCKPALLERDRGQRVSFLVNGHPLKVVKLKEGQQEVSIEVPSAALRSGENFLKMTYSESRTRDQPFSKKADDRAVEFSMLRVRPEVVVSAASASIDIAARRLFIPLGTRVDFLIDSVDRGEFTADGVNIVGADRARLVVSSQVGGARESVVGELNGERGRFTLPISGDSAAPVRLSLAAVGPRSPCKGPCGIVLTGPVVTSQASDANAVEPVSGSAVEDSPRLKPPNVVIYLIDALRADHLGCYGYHLPTSPSIDRFAEEAVLFERAQAQTSWTRASVASVFTGLMPQVHQANDEDDALSEDVVTIAEYLLAAGYQTAGFISNSNAGPKVGFGQGFEVFRHVGHRGEAVRSEVINDAAENWLDGLEEDRPFLLWIHAVDPHAPYMPPDDLRAEFAPTVDDSELGSIPRVMDLTLHPETVSEQVIADLISLYDAEIAANDRSFGALVDGLRRRGLYDDTLIILLSDHGEEFYDHDGWTHGKTLFAEQLDIPLIIRYPRSREGRRLPQIVQHVDILPTVLEAVGLPEANDIQGIGLQRLLTVEGRDHWVDRGFSSLDLRGRTGTSVIDGRWKMIRFQSRGVGRLPMLFDKQADREEQSDLMALAPDRAASLIALERRFEAGLPAAFVAPAIGAEADKEMHSALKALGYVQ